MADKKPLLVVHGSDRPATVFALRNLLANHAALYVRAKQLVEIKQDEDEGGLYIKVMVPDNVIVLAHQYCQPVKCDKKGEPDNIGLPDNVAAMYLSLGEWGVPALAGITTAPLLRADGSIFSTPGYDKVTKVYLDTPPDHLSVPDRPTRVEAERALLALREAFHTFPFGDAALVRRDGLDYVDTSKPPGLDESSFLAALLTAVVRASLWTAPGVLVHAPSTSGSGAGKGLLLRAVCMIAFVMKPAAGTEGHGRDELDKRLTAQLLSGRPYVYLDNLNNQTLRSSTLASALTERPITIRPLGTSRDIVVHSAAFIMLTGNGLKVTEDNARRLLHIGINPRVDDPEARPFKSGFLDDIKQRRPELLSAVLTILRWGRQTATTLRRGLPFGSYEDWCEWVRDPLFTLGCADPVESVRNAKQLDPERRNLSELFDTWWRCHRDDRVKASELHEDVAKLFEGSRERQNIRDKVDQLTGTQHGGFVMMRHVSEAKWTTTTYSLKRTAGDQNTDDPYDPYAHSPLNAREKKTEASAAAENDRTDHRGHRGHRGINAEAIHERYRDPAYRRMREAELSRRAAGRDQS